MIGAKTDFNYSLEGTTFWITLIVLTSFFSTDVLLKSAGFICVTPLFSAWGLLGFGIYFEVLFTETSSFINLGISWGLDYSWTFLSTYFLVISAGLTYSIYYLFFFRWSLGPWIFIGSKILLIFIGKDSWICLWDSANALGLVCCF